MKEVTRQRQYKAMRNIRLGMVDLLTKGTPILRTKWFNIWVVRK